MFYDAVYSRLSLHQDKNRVYSNDDMPARELTLKELDFVMPSMPSMTVLRLVSLIIHQMIRVVNSATYKFLNFSVTNPRVTYFVI